MIQTELWYKEALGEKGLRPLEMQFLKTPSVETARPLLQEYLRAGRQQDMEKVWVALPLQDIPKLPPEYQPQIEYAFFSLVFLGGEDEIWGGLGRLDEDGPFHVEFDFPDLLDFLGSNSSKYHDATVDGMETLVKWIHLFEFDEEGDFVGEESPYIGIDDLDDWIYDAINHHVEFPGAYRVEFHLLVEPNPTESPIMKKVREWSQSLSRQSSMAEEEE